MIDYPFDNSLNSDYKASPLIEKGYTNINVVPHEKIINTGLLNAFSEKTENSVTVFIPLVTVSEANGGPKKTFKREGKTFYKGENWVQKHKRHKKQKGIVRMMLMRFRSDFKIPCVITLTRFAPTKLDRHDNLPMSMKWILDSCCEVITGDFRPGRADDNEEIDVKYRQVISKEYGVKIEVNY